MGLELTLIVAALVVALAVAPWRMLRGGQLLQPWLATLVVLPWLWAVERTLPGGVVLPMSGACLAVLMFGWPLAVATLAPVALLAAAFGAMDAAHAVRALARNGIVPATFGLALGLATRRWLPHHLFVYILGRGFFVTAVSLMAAGALAAQRQPLPPGTELSSLLVARWLIGWAEAVVTGMCTAIFVAFRPEWLATWSDRRYLPRD